MSGTTRGRRVHLANGHEFPNWTVESHLADGGLSSVYRARYTGLRVNEFPAVAALKITSLQPADLDRLVEEYENARHFSGHPQVVQVHDVFETETAEYGRCVVLVHELGEESLKDHLAKHGALTRLESQRLAYNLAGGIAALHDAKIIHSDIKPANILSFPTGWKVADLGAAAVINAQSTATDMTAAEYYAGTLAYSTPEHASALHEGRRPPSVHRNADTWAFGVVLHEAASGVHPFKSTAALVAGEPTIDPALPPDLAAVIQVCLSPAGSRPRDGQALLLLLDQPPGAPAVVKPSVETTMVAPEEQSADQPVEEVAVAKADDQDTRRKTLPYLLATAVAVLLVFGAVAYRLQVTDGSEDQAAEESENRGGDLAAAAAESSDEGDTSDVASPTTTPAEASTSPTAEDDAPTTDNETAAGIRGSLRAGSVTLEGVVPSVEDQRSLVALMESVVGQGNVRSDLTVDADVPPPEDLSLAVQDEIQFETGSATIASEFTSTLDQIVTLMDIDPNLTVVIEGHTDSTGDKVGNLALSQRRADAVVEYIASEGINRFRLEPQGRGSTEPIASESTAEGRRQNRRIEFSLQGLQLSP